jgi:hypothetical protein
LLKRLLKSGIVPIAIGILSTLSNGHYCPFEGISLKQKSLFIAEEAS